jgi:hypothetical protein
VATEENLIFEQFNVVITAFIGSIDKFSLKEMVLRKAKSKGILENFLGKCFLIFTG